MKENARSTNTKVTSLMYTLLDTILLHMQGLKESYLSHKRTQSVGDAFFCFVSSFVKQIWQQKKLYSSKIYISKNNRILSHCLLLLLWYFVGKTKHEEICHVDVEYVSQGPFRSLSLSIFQIYIIIILHCSSFVLVRSSVLFAHLYWFN